MPPRSRSILPFALALAALLPARAAFAQDAAARDASARPRLLRPADIDALPLATTGTRLPYGEDSLQFGELRVPPGAGPFPVAIVIHGGCWYSPYAAVRNAAPLADALVAEGVATWNVEYRRYDHPGGGWPGTFADVGRAADHLRALARSHPLDTTRVVAIGHSAGAQLAAWLATRDRLAATSPLHVAAPLPLAGVVSLGGVMDMREFQQRQRATCGTPAIESVLGGLPDAVPERYAAVSPIERLPLGVPHHHVAGERDGIATREVVDAFATRARAAGDAVTVTIIPGLGHHDVMAPRTAGGRAAIAAVRALLGGPARD